MSKQGTPIRYDLYSRPTTPRLPPIFIESHDAADTSQLFKTASRAFLFDRTELLKFFNSHPLDKFRMASKKGGMIVKVFSDSSPKQRIECDSLRVNGIYEKDMTEARKIEKEQYQKMLDKMLKLVNGLMK